MARVVVVGGGYGGITASRALEAAFPDGGLDVVLVEPRDAFHHNVAALRTLVQPDLLESVFMPYDRLLSRGTVLRDRVVSISADGVLLESGPALAADFTVLATGSRYPFPAKTDCLSTSDSLTRYRSANAELAGADHVALLGAGPVGVELAGEIASAFPGKRITLLDQADDILPGPYDQRLRDELRRQLEAASVRILLGSSAAPDADLCLRCHGLAPVTAYLDPATLRDGHVRVTPDLRVVGFDTVYAVGDITDVDAHRVAVARAQAELVAANITARLTGSGTVLSYTPLATSIIVPLGPRGGAGQRDNGDILPAEVVSAVKGGDMFVDRYRALLNL
jgi:NADH dehydrogenase FAD-containing subunit